jgi:hypothetical protein
MSPYFLLNTGSGQFTQTRTNIPAGKNQVLDPSSAHHFAGATLTDLNGDGLPELIATADSTGSFDKLTRTTILWNRAGAFSEADKTELPAPVPFPTHIDMDAQPIDLNGDGAPDLVIVGTQGQPFYDGRFVQLLINRGDQTFVDVTANRLGVDDRFGGIPGAPTQTPWPMWVKVLDYNGDRFPDFAVEYWAASAQGLPLIYLNDGTGHFSTLKVRDFVAPGNEWALGSAHLMATRSGYTRRRRA